MRVPQWVSDFFDWRWAPCVGLTGGSLAFVALALLVIPTHFGGEPRVVSALSAYENARPQRAIFSSALVRPELEAEEQRAEAARTARPLPPPSPRRVEPSAPVQRGFSPIIERPEPPPVPPPPAPAAPPASPPASPIAAALATATAIASARSPAAATVGAETPASVPGTIIQPVPGGEAREIPPQ